MEHIEKQICWISTDPSMKGDWSHSGHRTGQLVSEIAYLVTNL